VTASRVIEPIDVFEDRHLSLSAGVPGVSPDQLCLDGFEERFNGGVVIAISLATHGCPEPMLAQDLLIIVRTILAATISMMNAALGWCPQSDGHLYKSRFIRLLTAHTITRKGFACKTRRPITRRECKSKITAR
jgi:hypothetical protein